MNPEKCNQCYWKKKQNCSYKYPEKCNSYVEYPKLKRCPFCGGEASLISACAPGQWIIRCEECCIGTLAYPKYESVAKQWNRRTEQPSSRFRNDKEEVDE